MKKEYAIMKDLERLFFEDIREKKKAGNGIHSRKGHGVKNGLKGALRTPYFFASTKQKNKMNGAITVSNLYSTILPYEEFKLKDKDRQRQLLMKWRDVHSTADIKKQMKLANQQFYNLINDLNIPKKPRTGGRIAKSIAIESLQPKEPKIESELILNVSEPLEILNGLQLKYKGVYNAEQLQKIFTKLQLLTEGEQSEFKINLSLTEVQN